MLAKIGCVMIGIGLAMLAIARIESIAAHRGLGESTVWAQEPDDQGDNAASEDDADGPDAKGCKAGPAGGLYSGNVMDFNMGAGKIQAALSQCRSKLSGVWQDTFVPPAFWNGTIKSNGAISARMTFHISGKCGYVFNGAFINGDEISGDYTLNGCKGMTPDHGTLDMFKD